MLAVHEMRCRTLTCGLAYAFDTAGRLAGPSEVRTQNSWQIQKTTEARTSKSNEDNK